jgi:hypothetical protein
LFENAVNSLNDYDSINSLSDTMNQIGARISNMYTTGLLQKIAESELNVTLSEMKIKQPDSDSMIETITKIAKIEIFQPANNCSAQTPCLSKLFRTFFFFKKYKLYNFSIQVQPILKIVDENVSLIFNVIIYYFSNLLK